MEHRFGSMFRFVARCEGGEERKKVGALDGERIVGGARPQKRELEKHGTYQKREDLKESLNGAIRQRWGEYMFRASSRDDLGRYE